MLDNLWKCFETTGDIETYLSFKDYERLREGNDQIGENEITDGLMNDGKS